MDTRDILGLVVIIGMFVFTVMCLVLPLYISALLERNKRNKDAFYQAAELYKKLGIKARIDI